MKNIPDDYEEIREHYSNFDHVMDEGMEEKLKSGKYYAQHAAYYYCGYIWYENKMFYEVIHQFCSHIDTLKNKNLKELIIEVIKKYGSA